MNTSLAAGRVLLLGGASHAGKSTLGQLLALGGHYCSTDVLQQSYPVAPSKRLRLRSCTNMLAPGQDARP